MTRFLQALALMVALGIGLGLADVAAQVWMGGSFGLLAHVQAILLNLNGVNVSAGITQIQTTNDTNTVATETSDDVLQFDMGANWPTADLAEDLSCTGCVSEAELGFSVATQAELDAATAVHNLTATTDPDLNVDCVTEGYALTSLWVNTDPGLPAVEVFRCQFDQAGDARWASQTTSLQEAYMAGDHGLTDVPRTRPELFQPEKALSGAKIERWGESLGIVQRRTDASGNPMSPDAVVTWFNTAFDLYTEVEDDPSNLKRIISVENVAGVTTVSFLDESGNDVLRWPVVGNGLVLRDERERSTVLEEVAATHDNQPFGDFLKAATIQSVWCRCSDVTGTLPTFTLSDGAGNAMTITDTNPVCTSYSAAQSAKTVTAANSLVAGEMLLFHTTNTPTAGKTCQISVSYTLD